MRKSLFFAALAIGMFASCTINELNEVQDTKTVTWQAVTQKNTTKAMVNGTDYTNDLSFLSAAFGTNVDGNIIDYITPTEISWHDATGDIKAGWRAEEIYYWPSFDLTFFSAHPYSLYTKLENDGDDNTDLDITSKGVILKNFDITENQDVDFMVADKILTNKVKSAENGVSTVFRHKLIQFGEIRFSLDDNYTHDEDVETTGDYKVYINKISLLNIPKVGTYESGNDVSDINLGEWKVISTINEVPILEETANSNGIDENDQSNLITAVYDEEKGVYGDNFLKERKQLIPGDFSIITTDENNNTKKDQAFYFECSVYRYTAQTTENKPKWDLIKTKQVTITFNNITLENVSRWDMGTIYNFNVIVNPVTTPIDPTDPTDNTPIFWEPSVENWKSQDIKIYI